MSSGRPFALRAVITRSLRRPTTWSEGEWARSIPSAILDPPASGPAPAAVVPRGVRRSIPDESGGEGSWMSLPLAAAGAVLLALLELSVAPYLQIAGLKPDLVLIVVVSVASFSGLERAFAWAFVGGLMLDLLSAGPYRPVGATAFTLLIVAGLASITVRAFPSGRIAI